MAMGGTRRKREGLRWEPETGSLVADDPIESLGPAALQVRSPFLEQLAVQAQALSHRGRELKPRELEVARPIFGASIDYKPVRIVNALLLNSPTTLGNYIRIANERKFHDAVLLHELTHVWQFQTQGTRYISNSLCSQFSATLRTGDRDAAYEVFPSQLHSVRSFKDLSVERQARMVELYFIASLMRSPDRQQRDRVRTPAFSRLAMQITKPSDDAAQFEREYADLQRLVDEIKLARPREFVVNYYEALAPSLGAGGVYDGQSDRVDQHLMPVFRIDF
jgi:hypothetical protein